jgi:predicted nucleic acid-binding protein
VLVYAAAEGAKEDEKRQQALQLIETTDFGLSAQVLQEFYVTVVRKIDIPMPPEKALEWIQALQSFPCMSIDASLVKIAAELSERYRISYWDGAIVAAAEGMNAAIIYSEDLNREQYYGSVQVKNPFVEQQR